MHVIYRDNSIDIYEADLKNDQVIFEKPMRGRSRIIMNVICSNCSLLKRSYILYDYNIQLNTLQTDHATSKLVQTFITS